MTYLRMMQVFVVVSVIHFTSSLGDDTLSADLCSDPVLLFNSTSSVLLGSQVKITCSVLGNGMLWNSSHFAGPVVVDTSMPSSMELNGTFVVMFDVFEAVPAGFCSTTTATITSVQESMDGLDLTCQSVTSSGSSSTVINVIDPPPGVVVLDADQDCSNVVTSWTALPDVPSPIVGYNVSISGSSLLLAANQTNYTHPISDSDCGNTLEISVSAVSAAGTGNITTTSLMIVCTPTDVSIVGVNDTSAVVQWTPMDVPGVVGYEVMSVSVAESPSTVSFVSANMDMASVLVDDYTIPVTFTVTSLLNGNEICHASQTTLPVLRNANQISPNFGVGTVTFPFLHVVMTSSLSVNWSPANGICAVALLEMDVIVICTELTNDVEYIVTIEITLIVNGELLPVSFSESFTPIAPPLFSSTPSATATCTPTAGPIGTVPEGCNYGFAVGLSVSLTFLITAAFTSLLTVVATWCLCVGEREKKTTPTGSTPLYEIPSTDPGKEPLKISPNAAYGHVQPQSTAHASSMYDSVAL